MGDNRQVPSTSSSLRDDVVRRATDEPDAVCAAAEPLARKAATEIADPGTVGEHLTVRADGDRTATHYFLPGQGIPRLAVGGDGVQGAAQPARNGQRGGPAARSGRRPAARLAALGGADRAG